MLQCGLCEKKFSSNDELREHLEGHASQPVVSDEEFQENEIEIVQDSDQDLDESLVFNYTKEKEQLQSQREETQGDYGSEESTSFTPAEAVEKRRKPRGKKSSETFMCSKCLYKTINKDMFKAHMNQMHLNKYKCNRCPKRFSSKGHLSNHIREKHMKDEDKPQLPEDEFFRITKKDQRKMNLYECLKCPFKTPCRTHIYQHIRGVHRELLDELYKSKGMVLDDSAYHKCTKCSYKTLYMGSLKQHIKTVHQKRRDFVCDLCKKTFLAKSYLIKHMKSIHISYEPSDQHKCSICKYKTMNKDLLKRHLNLVHLKIRKFTCDLCYIQFSEKGNLRRHIEKVHLKRNESLSCNRGINCSFRTTNKRELSLHIRQVHEKIQGFSCKICGKWYSSRRGLWSHKKTHLSIGVSITNRLTCDLCQTTTTDRKYMNQHMKRKHLTK